MPAMTDVLAWTLGDRMRKARRTAGLTTADLAAELGVHQTTITKFEADTATGGGTSGRWIVTSPRPSTERYSRATA